MMTAFDQTPDAPEAFGYKTFWFAIGTDDPASVIDALDVGPATPANWTSGLAAATGGGDPRTAEPWMFVSPPVDGWVLAASTWLPYPVAIDEHPEIGRKFDALFARLMARFGDVQFFGSHRVVDLVTWARARGGKAERIFAYADGGVLANFGEQTAEEAQLGFLDLSGLSPEEAGDEIFAIAEARDLEEERLIASGMSPRDASERVRESGRDPFPDESDAVDLATRWSIDPTQFSDQDHPAGVGLAVLLPRDLVP